MSLSSSHEPPIQSAPFHSPRRWALSPRLHLYVDRLDLTEWWGWRRVWGRLPLNKLVQIDAPTSTTLTLRTRAQRADCTPLALELDAAEEWARAIRSFQACLDGNETTDGGA